MRSADGGQLIERRSAPPPGQLQRGGGRVCGMGGGGRRGKYRRGWLVEVGGEGGVEGYYRERRGLSTSFIADSSLPPSLWQMDFHNAETM